MPERLRGTLDEVCVRAHWSLVAGDLLMYLGLVYTVAGFLGPLDVAIGEFATRIPNQAAAMTVMHTALRVAAGSAWFLATYVGPLVALKRSPFSRPTNVALGIAYMAVLMVLCWISALSVQVETLGTEGQPQLLKGVLKELVQPFRW